MNISSINNNKEDPKSDSVLVVTDTLAGASALIETLKEAGVGHFEDFLSPSAAKQRGLTMQEYIRSILKRQVQTSGRWSGIVISLDVDKIPLADVCKLLGTAPLIIYFRETDILRVAAESYILDHLSAPGRADQNIISLPDLTTIRGYLAHATQKRLAMPTVLSKLPGKLLKILSNTLCEDTKARLKEVAEFIGAEEVCWSDSKRTGDDLNVQIDRVVEHVISMSKVHQITMRRQPRKIDARDPLRVAVVMMVKDEEDIIFSNLSWHFAMGLRQFVVLNNMSSDNTVAEIGRFMRMCEPMGARVVVMDDREVAYYQSRKTTAAAHFAQSYFGAEWVLALDADEFLFCDKGDLLSVLYLAEKNMEQELGMSRMAPLFMAGLQFPLVDHFCTSLDSLSEPNPIKRLGFRRRKSKGGFKTGARWAPDQIFEQGNHHVSIVGGGLVPALDGGRWGVHIRHFPLRSFEHFIRKVRNGGVAYLNVESRGSSGKHWIDWYKLLQSEGENALREIFAKEFMLDANNRHFDPLPAIIFEKDRVILDRKASNEKIPLNLPIHGEQIIAIGGVSFTPHQISIHAPPSMTPIHLRMNTSDLPTFYQVFSLLEYDIEFPNELKVIVDLGANIGLAAAYLKGRYPDAIILCVEPNKENYQMLQQNIAGLDGVTAIHAAVWPVLGRLEVVDTDASGKPLGFWGAQTRPVSGDAQSADAKPSDVLAITIGEIMRRNGFKKIDLLKVDIEGAELELFSENTLEWLPHVESIVIETHDRFKPGSTAAVRAALEPYGYEERRSGENLVYTKMKLV